MDKAPVCRLCNKEVKLEVYYCVTCDKYFHPGCIKLHKVYNKANELIPCDGKIEKHMVKNDGKTSGESSKDRKVSATDSGQKQRERSASASASVNIKDTKIDNIYKMVQEIKDEMIGKNILRRAITEVIEEEMNRVREEIQHWKFYELETIISEAVKVEMQKVLSIMPMPSIGTGQRDRKELQRSCKKESRIGVNH